MIVAPSGDEAKYLSDRPRTNVATTIEFFDKRCVIVLQPFKCTEVVLKSDYDISRYVIDF